MKQIVILTVSLMVAATRLAAQEVKGRVTDKDRQPIEGATVVMQTPDSVFVDGVTTDSLGCFVFHRTLNRYRLIFQHLLYKSVVKDYDASGDVGTVVMDEQGAYALDEVVVRAERPLVKAENGALTYDVEALAEKTTASNAYEVLTRLPGVWEQGGSLSLIGAGSVTVVLNGRPSSMSGEQLANLLKNTSVSNVEKAEVMYSAPAKCTRGGHQLGAEESEVRGTFPAWRSWSRLYSSPLCTGQRPHEPFFRNAEGDGRCALCGRLYQTEDGLRFHLPPYAGRRGTRGGAIQHRLEEKSDP